MARLPLLSSCGGPALLAASLTAAACDKSAPASAPPVAAASLPAAQAAPSMYPATQRIDVIDMLHGVGVADPYRWLEDLDSPETAAWVAAQNEVTFGYLEREVGPLRAQIRERLTALWNFERYGVPVVRGGRYFFSRNDGLQNQSVMLWAPKLDAEPKVLLDPNTLSDDGTVALGGAVISDDGRYLAYGVAASGSDWQEWRVREVATGKDLPEVLQWVKFSEPSWTKDGKGFFYSRYDEPAKDGDRYEDVNYFQKLYYHRIGTPQADDVLVYDRPDHKDWNIGGKVSDDGRYLVIEINVGTERKNALFVQDLKAAPIGKAGSTAARPTADLLTAFDAEYTFVGNQGRTLWLKTDAAAPRGRVVAVQLDKPAREAWRELIPEHPEDALKGVSVVGERFIAQYLHDAHSKVRRFKLDGTADGEVQLPGIGTVAGFQTNRKGAETFFQFSSFTSPGAVIRYDAAGDASAVWKAPTVAFDPDRYVTEQVFYSSKDGTRVPMFVSRRKDLQIGEGAPPRPTYLYGYGGFDIAITPSFSVPTLVWMEMGGVYAVANLRGGGEYGEQWHLAGTKHRKQNVFDDFIAAAEHLIATKVTQPAKLAIGGRSNGGLLIGAAITQRPELFGAALPGVGVLDMLRFHKFTIGWAWTSDYGNPDDPADFKALLAYSPLHNVRPGTAYPATMVHTADHDDRVVPSHSFKFISALQAAQAGPDPVLIRIDVKAGHGAGKPTSKQIEEWADLWGFVAHELDWTPELVQAGCGDGAAAPTRGQVVRCRPSR